MGTSITGESFSSIHGDLVTELFNRETKGTSGPFRSGFSTNIEAVNTWVNTIYIHGMLRVALRKELQIKTSSKHKELTRSGKKMHSSHVSALKSKLRSYGIDHFSARLPRCITTGEQIMSSVSQDMLSASITGNDLFLSFVDERLIKGTKSFFAPIKKVKLNTGIIRVKKPIKAISVLKEDRQAIGLIISKSVSLKEAFSFPITAVPLSISTPEGNLRQSEKASFRNFFISKCDGPFSIPPKNAAWFVDGLAAVRTLKPKKTYREWLKNLLHFREPPADASPRLIGMINDMYLGKSVKKGTRSDRGSSSQKVTLQGFKQHMPQGVRWSEFLHNCENKNELIKLIARFVQSEEGRSWLKYPFIVTEGTQTCRVEKSQSMFLYSCK